MKCTIPLLWLLSVLIVSSGCATHRPSRSAHQAPDYPADPGYFLTMKQKGQLIGKGRVQDSQDGWYNIWICPGYTEPFRDAGEGWGKSGETLAKYVQRNHYSSLADDSGDAFDWAIDDCLMDFTVEGTPKAWSRYFGRANERAGQRVFGWWMAHPWALMQSGVDTVVRVPLGLTGAVLGTAWGGIVVPVKYAVEPAIKATWYAVADGVALPGVACAWNTVIAPPMALVGEKPAPERVDGFWVRYISNEEILARVERERTLTEEEVTAAASLAGAAFETFRSFDDRFTQNRTAFEQKQRTLRDERTAATQALEVELIDALREVRGTETLPAGSRMEQEIRNRLVEERGMRPQEAGRLIQLLRKTSAEPRPDESGLDYTDPAKESIRVIEDLD